MPAWCSPWKGYRSMPGAGLAVGGPRGAHAAGEPGRPDGRAGAGVARAADAGSTSGRTGSGLAHSVTAAVSLRQRLGERVDGVGELLDLRLVTAVS